MTSTYGFGSLQHNYQGCCFGLTKVSLAEGDAPFPLERHRNSSLRNPPVEKNNDACAGGQLQEKTREADLTCSMNESIEWITLHGRLWQSFGSRLGCFIMEFPRWTHACVLAGACDALLRARALCKGAGVVNCALCCPAKK